MGMLDRHPCSVRSSSSSDHAFKGRAEPGADHGAARTGAEIETLEEDVRLRKRLFNVVMECLQNPITTMPGTCRCIRTERNGGAL